MSRNDFNFFWIFKQLFNNFDNGKAYFAGVVDTIGEFLSGVNDTGQWHFYSFRAFHRVFTAEELS